MEPWHDPRIGLRPQVKLGTGHSGVFAKNRIPKDVRLTKYVGREYEVEEYKGTGDYALHVQVPRSVIIDATPSDPGIAQFVNDYRNLAPVPNAIFTPGGYLVTLRDIASKEEILVDYGEQYWRNRPEK